MDLWEGKKQKHEDLPVGMRLSEIPYGMVRGMRNEECNVDEENELMRICLINVVLIVFI
jgi:hypothetical protein